MYPDGKPILMLHDEEWLDFMHLDFDDFALTVKVDDMAKRGGGRAFRPIAFPDGMLLRLEVTMQKVRSVRPQF